MNEKKRILFVDDDRNVLDGLRRMLHSMRNQWKMEFVSRGLDALRAMRDTHYDIIVSDLRMPGMDGLELLERVRKKHSDTIRFILSGYNDQPLQGRAARCVHQFISKPYDADHLKNLISRAFALHDRLRSKEAVKVLSMLRSLPVMPKAYREVIEVLSRPDCSPRQVGKMISRDIGMSTKILQVVNSAFYGQRSCIADPVHAVTYLGLRTIEALVLTNGVFSQLPDRKIKEFSVNGLQEHCLRVGSLAKAICRLEQMSQDDLEVASMAGILHDTGKIILISKFAKELREALRISRGDHVPLWQVEQDLLNVTHSELGGGLLDLWGLPNTIIEGATFHHAPWHFAGEDFTVFSAVYAANAIDHELCSGCGDGWSEGVDMSYLERLGVADHWGQWRKIHLPVETGEYEHVG